MAQVKFYLEKRKGSITNLPRKKKGRSANVPIILKYSFLGQRLEYYTGYRCKKADYIPKYWESNTGNPIRVSAQFSEHLNESLKIIRDHVYLLERKAKSEGAILSTAYFKDELNRLLKSKPDKAIEKMTLLKYFDVFIELQKNSYHRETGHHLGKTNPTRYENIKQLLIDFGNKKGVEIDFDDIDERLYNEIVAYMITEKQYSINTYGRAIKYLKTVLNKATSNGYNTNLKYKGFFQGATECVDSPYLNEGELQDIWKLDLSDNPCLDRVRDQFLVGCWTGLRFGDFTTIRKEDISGDRIRVKTEKTKNKVVIPIHETVKAILKKYEYELPPPISNQKFNDYIKKVAAKANINTLFTKTITKGGETLSTTKEKHEFMSSHCARRSFATNAYKRKIEPLLIMAITGHKTETEFLKYIKLSEEEKAEMFTASSGWKTTKTKTVKTIKTKK